MPQWRRRSDGQARLPDYTKARRGGSGDWYCAFELITQDSNAGSAMVLVWI